MCCNRINFLTPDFTLGGKRLRTSFYAIQPSYLKSDGIEKPLYLAWDILPTERIHQYQIFLVIEE